MITSAKPIIFNTEMVRAILDGRKTETRRPMKPQPLFHTGRRYIFADETCPKKWEDCDDIIATYQYQPGDILYVRETWQQLMEYEILAGRPRGPQGTLGIPATPDQKSYYCYRADGEIEHIEYGKLNWLPSIHMPKEAARIFLKVTEVKVERVQDITEEGAKAEGFASDGNFMASFSFCDTWETIYKNRGYAWDANPWVWVIKFELLEA